MKKVLLICGTGASSGFMAGNIRQAVKSRGLDYEVKAKADSVVEEYIEDIDVLLVGPHLSYMFNELEKLAVSYKVPIKLIPREIYGALDGEAALDLIIESIKEEN